MENWTKVYSTGERLKADLLVAELHENDIEYSTLDKIETVTMSSGLIEIYVKNEDARRAVKIIQESDLTHEEE